MIPLPGLCRYLLVMLLLGVVKAGAQTAQHSAAIVQNRKEILTPLPKAWPRINGPLVYGSRPGHPFLYRIPCQGKRPFRFSIKNLPDELQLDPVVALRCIPMPRLQKQSVVRILFSIQI
jgi:hypothetical protein